MMPPTVTVASLGHDMGAVKQAFIDLAAAMRDEYVMLVERDRVGLAA